MGWSDHTFSGPCVVIAQGDKDDLVAAMLAKVGNGKIRRLNLCCVPQLQSARRSGDYSGQQNA
jgi:hypothetical protein